MFHIPRVVFGMGGSAALVGWLESGLDLDLTKRMGFRTERTLDSRFRDQIYGGTCMTHFEPRVRVEALWNIDEIALSWVGFVGGGWRPLV